MAELDLAIDGLHPVEVLGTGGFATVYRARDARLDDDVAVKVLAENHSLDPDIRERFIREAQALRRVAGDHIVRLHDIGETGRSQPYMVLEYARNGDLAQRANQRANRRGRAGPATTPADVRRLVTALRSALGSLHSVGLIHRDLSPSNLLLTPSGDAQTDGAGGLLDPGERVVLADLGLVKDLARSSGLTVGGGTSGFSAPEQARPSAGIDHRADIYGASAVVAWSILGRPPAEIGSDLGRGLELAGHPEALAPVLTRGMATDPSQRQPTIEVWADEIERALAPAPSSVPPAPLDTMATPPPPSGTAPSPPLAGTMAPSSVGWAPGLPVGARVLVGGGILAGLLLAGSLWLGSGLLGRGARTTALDDGTVRVARSDRNLTVAIVGPDEITVGQSVVYRAELEGAQSSVWLAPDGRLHPDVDTITIAARSAGELRVGLMAVDPTGKPVIVHHDVIAVAEPETTSG